MNIFVINCGSSSLKYQLINSANEEVLAVGIAERIGIDGSRLKYTPQGKSAIVTNIDMPNHTEAIKHVLASLMDAENGVIKSLDEINAVGHRVVHGGEKFNASTLITEDVVNAIKECVDLAPLHNPANLIGIDACKELMPNVPMVAVFDTAFHQTMPQKAYLYGIPFEYYNKYKLRRYGFHGTSHSYVSTRAAEMMGKPVEELKIVVCHLGNGASICAVDGGKSVDTSMGFTPLEGLVMGTRSGDIDPAIIEFLADKENLTLSEVVDMLNKKSGVLGVSTFSSDFRDLEDAIYAGDERAIRALDVFEYRVAKYVGAYAAAMNGIDAVVFTAGLGENNKHVRKNVCDYLTYLGIEVDEELNNCRSTERDFTKEGATVKSLVIPTNEELMISRDTVKIVSAL